jgi:hypothetical protein
MTNAFLQPTVVGPARVPVKYGLFSVLDFTETADSTWEGAGVQWQSFDGGNALGVIGQVATPQSDTEGLPKSFTYSGDTDTAGVFTIYAQRKITPGPGWTQETMDERVNEILLALAERTVEQVLTGDIGSLTPNLGDATIVDSTSRVIDMVAALERNLSANYGSRGVIHMGRGNALIGLSLDACLVSQGNGIYTKLGTPVVAGQGYPEDIAWCTSAMTARRSGVLPTSGRSYDLLDTDDNNLYAIAEETFSIGWEAAALAAVTIGDSPA